MPSYIRLLFSKCLRQFHTRGCRKIKWMLTLLSKSAFLEMTKKKKKNGNSPSWMNYHAQCILSQGKGTTFILEISCCLSKLITTCRQTLRYELLVEWPLSNAGNRSDDLDVQNPPSSPRSPSPPPPFEALNGPVTSTPKVGDRPLHPYLPPLLSH